MSEASTGRPGDSGDHGLTGFELPDATDDDGDEYLEVHGASMGFGSTVPARATTAPADVTPPSVTSVTSVTSPHPAWVTWQSVAVLLLLLYDLLFLYNLYDYHHVHGDEVGECPAPRC